MAEKREKQQDPIDAEELEEQNGEVLPDREVMSTIDPTGEPVIWELPVEPRSGT